MSDDVALPLEFTDAAANKVKSLIADEDNPNLKLRVYITGGGCSGFQYGFTFDDQVNEGDMTIEKQGVGLVVDPMSLQYLVGGSVDYTEGLEGSRFIVTNPNAKAPAVAVLPLVSNLLFMCRINYPAHLLFNAHSHPAQTSVA